MPKYEKEVFQTYLILSCITWSMFFNESCLKWSKSLAVIRMQVRNIAIYHGSGIRMVTIKLAK